jgi:hypothetical protein
VPAAEPLDPVYRGLLAAAVAATVGSAVQYTVKAARLLRPTSSVGRPPV